MPVAIVDSLYAVMQLFALSYHQSRWNYNDQDDVARCVVTCFVNQLFGHYLTV
jgi:hypothetical protein